MVFHQRIEDICIHSSVTRELQYKGLVCKCKCNFTKRSFQKENDCEYKSETFKRKKKKNKKIYEPLTVVTEVFAFSFILLLNK